jgi:hypothetical protein
MAAAARTVVGRDLRDSQLGCAGGRRRIDGAEILGIRNNLPLAGSDRLRNGIRVLVLE